MNMNIKILILLCVVQGLTEFLPVSSSGHLLLIEQIFGISENTLLLNLFLHLASLVAVVIFYRDILKKILKKPFQPLTYKLIISTAITVVLALAYEGLKIDAFAENHYGYFFIATSVLLAITYFFQKKSVRICLNDVSYKNSVLVGLVQGIAVMPGISRSGSTISSLVLSGVSEEKSAEYSFLLSIPVIVGGFLFELLKIKDFSPLVSGLNPLLYLMAFVLTFLVALLSLKITVKMLKQNKFIYFSVYLLILGIVVIFFVK